MFTHWPLTVSDSVMVKQLEDSGDAHHVVNPVMCSQLNNMWSIYEAKWHSSTTLGGENREYFQTTALKYIFVCIYLLTYMYYLRMIMKGTQDDDDGSNRHHLPLFPLFQTFHSTWNAQGHMPAVLPATGGSPAVNVHFTPFMHSLAFFARGTAYQRIIQGGAHLENHVEVRQPITPLVWRCLFIKKQFFHTVWPLVKKKTAIYRGNLKFPSHIHIWYILTYGISSRGAHLVYCNHPFPDGGFFHPILKTKAPTSHSEGHSSS